MTPEILSTIGYNLVGIAIGAGTVVGAVVKPFQRKLAHATSALELATVELEKLRIARVIEKLDEHSIAIDDLRKDRVNRVAARFQEHAVIEHSVRKMIEQSDIEARAGRKHLHEDIGGCRTDITTIATNLKNLTGWVEKLDERFEETSKELIAAVANAAGRNGN